MSVAVVVPWRGGCPHRERAWMWVRQRYYGYGWKVVLACMEDGPWIKARAITPALEQMDAKYVVVADADVWCDAA